MTSLKDSVEELGFTEETLEISMLNIVKAIKTPRSNMSQGVLEFNRHMKGHYVPHDLLTSQVLAVTLQEVKDTLKELHSPKIAVSSSLEKFKDTENWQLISPLNEFKKSVEKKPSMK